MKYMLGLVQKIKKTITKISFSTITIDIPKSIISIMETNDIDPEKYGDLYKNYIDHLVGTTYGQETDQFDVWCEESDNIGDYQTEYTTDFDDDGEEN